MRVHDEPFAGHPAMTAHDRALHTSVWTRWWAWRPVRAKVVADPGPEARVFIFKPLPKRAWFWLEPVERRKSPAGWEHRVFGREETEEEGLNRSSW